MKSNKLKMYIRKIVREEVAMAINEVITELKRPPQLKQKPQKKLVVKKTYSSNSVLNDVLNETAQTADWETMGDGVYDSSRMDEVLQNAYTTEPQESHAGMNQFLTKNYSEVLKKSYEKSGKK